METKIEKPTYKELAEYLNVTEQVVKQYPKIKIELMVQGLWRIKENAENKNIEIEPASYIFKKEEVKDVDKNIVEVGKISAGNKKIVLTEDRTLLANKDGLYMLDLVAEDVSVNVMPRTIEIIEDRDVFPKELLKNKDFMFGKVDQNTDKFQEDFVFFRHRDLIQYCKPESYGLMDNLLIITDTQYEESYDRGYLFFRFSGGKLYLIENYKNSLYSPTFLRTFREYETENSTHEFYNFCEEVMKTKRTNK
jgi:hypothetical protein